MSKVRVTSTFVANMRIALVFFAFVIPGTGCQRYTIRTQSRVALDSPVDTRITDISPVSPIAGPVRPVVVGKADSGTRIAILDVDGLILNTPFAGPMSLGENPVALFREKLDAAEADACAKAVVLRVNSHGGGVAACIAMRRDMERFKARSGKPVVACLLDTATGGAYYLASGADMVVAGEATVTGALGVILNLFNLQDLMAQYNVIPQSVKSGVLVDIGSSSRPLKEAERTLLQTMADEFHNQLREDIKRSRPRLSDEQGTTFDGRLFTGRQALARGLVDRIGELDDAIQFASQLGCGDTSVRPTVTLYRRANDPANSIYAVTANIPLQGAGFLPNLPGLERSKIPTFLSVWQPELTMEKLGGK
jgi:protease-4